MDPLTDRVYVPGGRHSSSQLSRLCRACQSILIRDDLNVYEKYTHHISLEDAIVANRMKCYICSHVFRSIGSTLEDIQDILRQAAEGKTPDNVVEDDTQTTDDSSSNRGDDPWPCEPDCPHEPEPCVTLTYLSIRLYRGCFLTVEIGLNARFFPPNTKAYNTSLNDMWDKVYDALSSADRPMIVPDQVFTREFPTTLASNTGSMETWSTVDSWIKSCTQHHQCTSQVNTKWYPTRLIERTSNNTFRIIRSDFISQPSGGYITLSHRWGSTDPIKLTTDNLLELERGSPVAILPKTFQEALVVAQRLNIRYVWIDSLCIIQSGDNGADWQREAAEMANIYTNSFCNISADYGNNQTTGLFFERTPAFEPACAVHIRCEVPEDNGDDIYFYITQTPLLELRNGGLCHIMRPDGWFEDFMESPLNCRAWVLQERLLAPRVLHFLAGQVAWECGEDLAWEKAYNGLVMAHLDSCHFIETSSNRFGRLMEDRPFWKDLMERYSSLGMTKQSDRLVAISGIVRRMTSQWQGQYVAGLWSYEMPYALGWYAERNANQHRRPPNEGQSRQDSTEYYTPSFSWAATDGPVSHGWTPSVGDGVGLVTAFIKHRKKPLYSAVTKTGQPKPDGQILTDHVFGPLTSPVVEVQARGILRTCHRVPQHLVPEYLTGEHYFAPSKGINDSSMYLCFERDTKIQVSFDRPADSKDAEANDSTYYFTIYNWSYSDSEELMEKIPNPQPSDYQCAQGLLLKSVDPSMGRFKRVGHIRSHRYEEAYPWEYDISARLGNERGLPAWSYDETKGEHVFYIV